MTIGQLADRVSALGFPLERTQISKIENGHTNVDVEKLLALAAALDVIPDRLLRNPEDLDRQIWRRLMAIWERALWERERQQALVDVIGAELEVLTDRIGDEVDPVAEYSLSGWMNDTQLVIEAHKWRTLVERVAPDHPGYDEYLLALASGDVESVFDSELEPWRPAPNDRTKGSK